MNNAQELQNLLEEATIKIDEVNKAREYLE
jgi:hypothetical protein